MRAKNAKREKRRGNGEGSIYKRSDGRWCATYSGGYNADGKRMRRTLFGKSHEEVRDKLTKTLSTRLDRPEFRAQPAEALRLPGAMARRRRPHDYPDHDLPELSRRHKESHQGPDRRRDPRQAFRGPPSGTLCRYGSRQMQPAGPAANACGAASGAQAGNPLGPADVEPLRCCPAAPCPARRDGRAPARPGRRYSLKPPRASVLKHSSCWRLPRACGWASSSDCSGPMWTWIAV